MTAPEGLTETCVNQRLRELRKEAWSKAHKLTNFMHARMKWYQELSSAQYWDVPGADEFPPLERRWNHDEVKEWRAALVEQLLTSAPTIGDVTWKQAQLRSGQHRHIGVDDEAIERAIAADLEWLKKHPARKSQTPMSEERKTERREFKEAMRQRIRDIAASCDIPDDEIRPVLSLKHHLIADFVENYGVNFEWLLGGKGRIFKKDPITLNPNMTGSEFAAVVTTMPMADQQAITTKLREILQERDQ